MSMESQTYHWHSAAHYGQKSKVLPKPQAQSGADLLFLSQMPAYTARLADCLCPYGTHCIYPQRNGQAELTCVAGYIMRQCCFTRQSINRARHELTSSTETNILTTTGTLNPTNNNVIRITCIYSAATKA